MAETPNIFAPISKRNSPANRRQLERLEFLIERVKDRCLVTGVSGEVVLRLMVGDGTIQHVKKTVIENEC